MITITISINGEPILTRSASRFKGKDNEECKYFVDTGDIIKHMPDDGVVELAHKLLNTIKEIPNDD
jgi:hypothetical protein